MPICNHQLTSNELTQLQALASRCHQQDGNCIPIYSNLLVKRRNLPCNLLYYDQHQLIGFLSLFFFYDDACELTLMVDPLWRRQGIATRLIATIMPVIQTSGIHSIYYPSPKGLNDAWLPTQQLSYQKTEYEMEWKGTNPIQAIPDGLHFHKGTDKDIQNLTQIDVTCFHTDRLEMEARFQRLVHDQTYTLFLISFENQVIGKAHLHEDPDHIQLSDIAILPAYRNQGLGQILLNYCIQNASKISTLPLRLEVDSHNQNALYLYLKSGFKITNAWDLWK